MFLTKYIIEYFFVEPKCVSGVRKRSRLLDLRRDAPSNLALNAFNVEFELLGLILELDTFVNDELVKALHKIDNVPLEVEKVVLHLGRPIMFLILRIRPRVRSERRSGVCAAY